KALAQGGPQADGSIARDLGTIGELTLSAQTEIRELISELGRGPLEDGLAPALVGQASRLFRPDGPRIEVRAPEHRLPLGPRVEAQLFGIGREALANVVRHSGATTAWISVEDHPGHVVLEIRDDGQGFDPAVVRPGHFGLESMRSRAAEIGARLTIVSAPGRGTAVRVEAPGEGGSGSGVG